MDRIYEYEPTDSEIKQTEIIGNTLLKRYYHEFVTGLGIKKDDRVLDYCSGSGIISKIIVRQLDSGILIFADVSYKWLEHIVKKLKPYRFAKGCHIDSFDDKVYGGEYDKILIHFSLHDFPEEYRIKVMGQLVKSLKRDGVLFIREPLGAKHGMKLHELVNLIEYFKELSYEYSVVKKPLIGEYADIKCIFR